MSNALAPFAAGTPEWAVDRVKRCVARAARASTRKYRPPDAGLAGNGASLFRPAPYFTHRGAPAQQEISLMSKNTHSLTQLNPHSPDDAVILSALAKILV
jgi:hypothetical protein